MRELPDWLYQGALLRKGKGPPSRVAYLIYSEDGTTPLRVRFQGRREEVQIAEVVKSYQAIDEFADEDEVEGPVVSAPVKPRGGQLALFD